MHSIGIPYVFHCTGSVQVAVLSVVAASFAMISGLARERVEMPANAFDEDEEGAVRREGRNQGGRHCRRVGVRRGGR